MTAEKPSPPKFHRATPLGLALSAASLAAACGGAQSGKEPDPASQDIEQSYQAELQSLADGSEGGSALALANAEDDLADQGATGSTCTDNPQAGTTTVTNLTTADKARLFGVWYPRITAADIKVKSTRIWSKNGKSIGCDAQGKHALIDKRNLDGVTLKLSFEKTASRVLKKKGGSEPENAGSFHFEGSRTLIYKQETSGNLLINRITVESVVTSKSLAESGQTAPEPKLEVKTTGGPVTVVIQRDTRTLKLLSRTMESGALLTTRANGASLLAIFKNVMFKKGDSCLRPISGAITAVHTNPRGVQRTIERKFSSEESVLKISQGTEILLKKISRNTCEE